MADSHPAFSLPAQKLDLLSGEVFASHHGGGAVVFFHSITGNQALFAQPFGHRIVIKVVTDPIGEAWDAMIRRTAFAGPKQISKGNLPLSPDNKVNLTWA
jgi:hypothetical protein